MLNDRDRWTLFAMRIYGGSFIKALSGAAQHADESNLRKLKTAWPEYWHEYEVMGKELGKKKYQTTNHSREEIAAEEPEFVEAPLEFNGSI